MMIITTLFFIILLVLVVYYFYLHYGKKRRLINLIPGPPLIPVLGNALMFNVPQEKIWQIVCKQSEQYGPIFRIWVTYVPSVIISHPDDIETISCSTKYIEKGNIYKLFHPWLQTGLLTSGGIKWHTRRKLLTPTFHFSILQQFVDILVNESNYMVKTLKDTKETVVKELVPFVSEHTLNTICETALGISLRNTTSQKYRDAVHQMSKIICYRSSRKWLQYESILPLFPVGRLQKKTLKILHSFSEKIIAERKYYHERTNGRYLKNFENDTAAKVDDVDISGIKKRRLAMLDLLIAASQENKITDSDIREEVDTFTFEGHDTTAMGICFALMLLAEHKNIQDRVRLEVNTMIEENGDKFTISSMQKLPYLERCLKEALRLYPSVPFISRLIKEDVKLGPYTVPAETDVHFHIFGTHRDPNFWPNPDVFDPDRFLPERSKNRHPYSYLPFSAGPRNCIGQRFALLELKIIIASLIHNFYLEPVDYLKDVELTVDVILRPSRPVRIKFVPIKAM